MKLLLEIISVIQLRTFVISCYISQKGVLEFCRLFGISLIAFSCFLTCKKKNYKRKKYGLTHIRIYIPITSQVSFTAMETSLNVIIHISGRKAYIQKKTTRARNSSAFTSISSAEDYAEHTNNLSLI